MDEQDRITVQTWCRNAIEEGADLTGLIKNCEDTNRRALQGPDADSAGTLRGVAMRKLAVETWKAALT